MKTKGKLTFIVAIIGAILFLTASFQVWNSIAVYRMVKRVTPSLEVLRLLKEIQARFHSQQNSLLHFVVSGEEDSRQKFISYRSLINEDKLKLLFTTIQEQRASGVRGEKETEDNLNIVMERYIRYLEKAEACIELKRAGRTDNALRGLDTVAMKQLGTEILSALNRMGRDEEQYIHDAYRMITMRLGALPWVAGPGMQQVERAVSAVDFELAVSNTELGLYRQMNKLTEFLQYGRTRDWEKFLEYRFEMRRLLDAWHQVITYQMALGIEGEDDDEKQFKAIQARYENILPQMERTAAIRRSQGMSAGLAYVEHTLRFPLDNIIFSTMEVIEKKSREEVQELHDDLLRTVVAGGAVGLTGIVLVSVLALLLVLRMSNSIISSLTILKDGTERIKGGDLEHPIRIPGSDEFSELASSFNAMTDSLKEHNDELRSFVYIVSHDLRAPLVSVRGFAREVQYAVNELRGVIDRCLPGMSAGDRERLQLALQKDLPEALGFIDSSVTRMDSLINAILRLSRMGRSPLQLETIDLADLVEKLFQSVAHQVQEKKVTLAAGELPLVIADRFAMEQIMGNLIDNALKYLEPGRPGRIELSGRAEAGGTVISIRDNGCGVPPDDTKRIFEIFQRAGEHDVPGEGMGLAYVRTLVRRHNGRIWHEPASGGGSVFTFSLPHA